MVLRWGRLSSDYSKNQRIWAIWYARKHHKKVKVVLSGLRKLGKKRRIEKRRAGKGEARFVKTAKKLVSYTFAWTFEVDPPLPLHLPDETGDVGALNYDQINDLVARHWFDHEDEWKLPFLYVWGEFSAQGEAGSRWMTLASYELPKRKFPGLGAKLMSQIEFRSGKGYLKNALLLKVRMYSREPYRPREKTDPTLKKAKRPF